MLRRIPDRPYRNLLLSGLSGLPVGVFVFAAYLALFESPSLERSLVLLADSVLVSLLVAPAMAAALICYGLPSLWLALRTRLASPVTAFVFSSLPGVLVWAAEGWSGQVGWISLLVSISTGIAFVLLAYRVAPNSFKPTSPRAAAQVRRQAAP